MQVANANCLDMKILKYLLMKILHFYETYYGLIAKKVKFFHILIRCPRAVELFDLWIFLPEMITIFLNYLQ